MDMNYYDTFIEVAEDCPVAAAEVPSSKDGKRTIAWIHFDLIANHPYCYTQEDVLFETHAERRAVAADDHAAERERFFSKGQPCLRSSPLGKRYGWGVHADSEGRVALCPLGSPEYEHLNADPGLSHLKAMRSKRA